MGAMYNPHQLNISGGTPSTIKHGKKKAASIEKKSTSTTNSTIIHGNSSANNYNGNFSGMMSGDILKKTSIPKKSKF